MLIDTTLGDLETAAGDARKAEGAGYAGAFTGEVASDPFLPLALAAASTERITLGTAIAVAFARSPMALAYTAHDLQRLSRGRLMLGLGSQVRAHITRRFSMPWGRVGDAMTRMAGEVADGFLCHGFTTGRWIREHTLPALAEGRRRAGKTMDGFTVKAAVFLATGTEEETARAARRIRSSIAFYASTPAYVYSSPWRMSLAVAGRLELVMNCSLAIPKVTGIPRPVLGSSSSIKGQKRHLVATKPRK
jgi:alkanesulfonate monooxygenase SsuD/methylene tetrahydromethanopterin reductase-like flavin-dependent oxidoreductase (luciferase family)